MLIPVLEQSAICAMFPANRYSCLMPATLKLSVLDQSAAVTGRAQAAAIVQTLALAQHAEALGYHRFWVSEHHSHPSIVGSAPEVLMAAIAATTSRIRIGSAGVMLPHYAPLKVAEQFRVLEALAPGRIDLGVGRAPGSDMRTARLLRQSAQQSSDDFPIQVRELQAWVTGREGIDLPEGHPGHGVTANPTGPTSPTLWMLGSSDYGAQLAAHFTCRMRLRTSSQTGRAPHKRLMCTVSCTAQVARTPSRKRCCACGHWRLIPRLRRCTIFQAGNAGRWIATKA